MPTFKELGFDVVSERYRALAGPPGLPESVVSYWAGICAKVTKDPAFREEMNKIGQPPAFRGPAEAAKAVGTMQTQMQALIDKYGLAK